MFRIWISSAGITDWRSSEDSAVITIEELYNAELLSNDPEGQSASRLEVSMRALGTWRLLLTI